MLVTRGGPKLRQLANGQFLELPAGGTTSDTAAAVAGTSEAGHQLPSASDLINSLFYGDEESCKEDPNFADLLTHPTFVRFAKEIKSL